MKTPLLKITLICGLLMAGTTSLFAQNTIDAVASVAASVTFDQQENLDFGTVALSATNTVAITDNTAGDQSGQVRASGNATVTDINFSGLNDLLHTDGTTTMTTNYTDASWAHDNDGTAGEARDATNSFVPSTGASSLSIDLTQGALFIWLAGDVTAGANQKAGDYSNTVTVTLTFN